MYVCLTYRNLGVKASSRTKGRCQQSTFGHKSTGAGLFFKKSTVVGWKSWKSKVRSTFETTIDTLVNFWNHSRHIGKLSPEMSTVARSRISHVVHCWLWRIFFQDFEAILYEFCHFPTEIDEAKSTKNWQSTSCNSCDFFLNLDSWELTDVFFNSRQFGQLLKP
jgi:hypothetical protein